MCSIEKFLDETESMTDAFLFAMFTDEIWFENWKISDERKANLKQKENLLLEARIFNKSKEIKLFRTDIKKKFRIRVRDDADEYIEEEQYLDIDTARSKELFKDSQKVKSTGGGEYPYPFSNYENAKIRLHNYIQYYEETGQAYVSDWRLVEVFNESECKNEEGI